MNDMKEAPAFGGLILRQRCWVARVFTYGMTGHALWMKASSGMPTGLEKGAYAQQYKMSRANDPMGTGRV